MYSRRGALPATVGQPHLSPLAVVGNHILIDQDHHYKVIFQMVVDVVSALVVTHSYYYTDVLPCGGV